MHTRWPGVSSFAAMVALVLSGCGGGGTVSTGGPDGDGSGDTLSILDKWQRFADRQPTLRMTSAQVSEVWRATARKSTHRVILGPVGVGAEPASAVQIETDPCSPGECDLERPSGSSIWVFAPVLGHNQVPVAEHQARITQTLPVLEAQETTQRTLTDVLTYGGWLDYTEFRVSVYRWCTVGAAGCSGTDPDYENGIAFGFMAGRDSGTTPAGVGSATWTGVMVGMESPDPGSDKALDLIRSGPDVFLGDAWITIDDLAAPDVDVSFTNIYNVTEGTPHDEMSWEHLRVQDGGLFGGLTGQRDGNEYIAGMFTGPRHQEVGGEFRRGGIVGAFGAKRR